MNRKIPLLLIVLLGAAAQAVGQEQLTGMFRMSHTLSDIVDPQTAQALADIVAPDENLDWQVYVPEHYNAQRPPGLIVFFDPRGWGGVPDAWRQIVSDSNLIWVGPKKNEPRQSVQKKILVARLGRWAIEQQYALDLNRLYAVSLGNEAMSALQLILVSNDFRGAAYMRGSVYWTSIEPDALESLTRKRLVFVTGSNDKQKQVIRKDAERYKNAGINNVKLVFATRSLGNPPQPEYFAEAIRYLDDR